MSKAPDMQGYPQALDIARAALAGHPRAGLRIGGDASTIGDIAAHLVAFAAIRRGRGNPARGVERHLAAGREAIGALSLLTGDPDPAAGTPTSANSPGVRGRVGRDWSYNSGFLHHYGHAWHLSGTVPGVHAVLPDMHPDLDEMGARFRRELRAAGLSEAVAAKGVARVGANPHGGEDDRPWTEFALPMHDRRLDYVNHIVNLGHKADFAAQESLRSYARQAAEVHLNAATLSRMADAVETLCMDAEDEAPTLRLRSVSIHSVGINRSGKLKDSVVMHAAFTGLSEALLETPVKAVFTGEIGTVKPATTNLPAMMVDQSRRHRAMARLGGPVVDRTGLDLLRAAGHDVDAMLDGVRNALGQTEKRVHAGRGSKAWLKVEGGRVTASLAVTPEASWKHDRIEIRRALPESVLAGLAGRSAADVVDHPAFAGAIVRSASASRSRAVVVIEPRWEALG